MRHTTSTSTIRHGTRRPGRTSTVVAALVFAALGVPVYLLGVQAPPGPRTAKAIVCLPAGVTTEEKASNDILAAANVRRAIGTLPDEAGTAGAGARESDESIRNRLGVRLSTGEPSSAEVHIDYSGDEPPRHALRLVTRLAEQFAQAVRQRQKTEAAEAYHQAEQATAEAKKKLTEAQGRLDAFVQESLATSPTDKTKTADRADSAAVGPKANPNWLALRRRLDHARAYRASLLVDRTPLHPMVQAADQEIVDLEKRLAATDPGPVPEQDDLADELRQMTDPLPQEPGLIGRAAENVDTLDQPLGRFVPPGEQAAGAGPSSRSPAPDSKKRLETFAVLKREVDTAREDYGRAVARQGKAWRRQFTLAPVEVVAARVVTGPTTAARQPSRRATIAILVALAGAVGAGMIASGIGGTTTFADLAQARAALAVPVLGVVPAADHVGSGHGRRRWLEGAVLVVCGLFLLAVSAGVVLAASGIAVRF